MVNLSIEVPEGIFAALRKAPHEVAREMKIAAAIHWYQQGVVSMERAAETAGMTRPAFLDELSRRRVDVFTVDFDDLRAELADESPTRRARRD